jgi:hypothetical protein
MILLNQELRNFFSILVHFFAVFFTPQEVDIIGIALVFRRIFLVHSQLFLPHPALPLERGGFQKRPSLPAGREN